MTITSIGLKCDVCGEVILLDDYQAFTQKGISTTLHCHVPQCKQAIIDAGGDWIKLPDGPLRRMFETAWLENEPQAQQTIPGMER